MTPTSDSEERYEHAETSRLKLAIYWAAGCGGCDIAVVELGEHLLELAQVADIVFWPAATDFKYDDVERMDDGHIDVTLFNGGIRTTGDMHIAQSLAPKVQGAGGVWVVRHGGLHPRVEQHQGC